MVGTRSLYILMKTILYQRHNNLANPPPPPAGERYMELRTFAETLEAKNNSLAKENAYKDNQLQELQAAYKEKMRKCLNLENLYR